MENLNNFKMENLEGGKIVGKTSSGKLIPQKNENWVKGSADLGDIEKFLSKNTKGYTEKDYKEAISYYDSEIKKMRNEIKEDSTYRKMSFGLFEHKIGLSTLYLKIL